MNIGYKFKTNNYGYAVVTNYFGCFNVEVKFEKTGTKCITTTDQIKKGKVKDRFSATLCGVGYLGEKVPYINTVYDCWANMIKRCYDKSVQKKHPSYVGCKVCDEWLCFNSYYSWYISNYIEGYEVDKDKKVTGNRVYGPDFCLFIPAKENIQLASHKKYELTHKDGRVIEVLNLSEFARNNGLTNSGLFRLKSGERKSHKGWVKIKLIK